MKIEDLLQLESDRGTSLWRAPTKPQHRRYASSPPLTSQTPLQIGLSAAAADIVAFRRSALFKAMRLGKGAWTHRIETRFDTEDKRLAARGFSLVVNESQSGRMQTISRLDPLDRSIGPNTVSVKLGLDEAIPANSGEFEFDCALHGLNDLLAQAACVKADEYSAKVKYHGADIGCAFRFQAHVEAPGSASAVVVLTHRSGPKGAFFDAARAIARASSLRPVLLAKDSLPKISKFAVEIGRAPKVLAAATDVPADVLQKMTRSVAERILFLTPLIVEKRQPRALQQMRVAIRRLRATEKLYRPYLTNPTLRKLAKRGRKITRRLGVARDWDVFLTATLPAAMRAGYAPRGFDRLRWRAEARRAEAWEDAVSCLSGYGFAKFALDLLEASSRAPWMNTADEALTGDIRAFAIAVLDERLAIATAVADAMDRRSLVARHPLRIALKKLRYAVQLFRALYEKHQRKPFMGEIARLQDALGDINDAAVSHLLVDLAAAGEGDEASRAAGFLFGASASQAEVAAVAIDDAWEQFAAKTPFWRDEENTPC